MAQKRQPGRGGRQAAPAPPADVRSLVRRDVRLFAAGTGLAVVAWALFLVDRLGDVSGRALPAAVAAIGAIVGTTCFIAWLAGPAALRRDRYMVLVPLFLVAAPALLALRDLGGSLLVVLLSSAVGFGAAIAFGMAWAAGREKRRARARPLA